MDLEQYPPHWWQKVVALKEEWEILPTEVSYPEVIISKRNELGILSNFANTPFVFHGETYQSVEGFWQMLKYPEDKDDIRFNMEQIQWPYTRKQVGQLWGFEAKHAGDFASGVMKKLGINWVSILGEKIPYWIFEKAKHYEVIKGAMLEKLKQNSEVRRTLLSTGNLILKPDHVTEPLLPPAWQYCQIWMELRLQLQNR